MQIVNTSIPGGKVIFESILDEIPGGVSLDVTRLDNLTLNANVDKRYLPAGTPVYVNIATRVAEVCKSVIATGGTAQAIQVPKNHHYKVGDFLNDGITSSEISTIDETNVGYSILNTAEALVYAVNTKYGQGTVSGASVVLAYTPNGMTKDTIFVGDGNADVAIVKMGTVRADALTFPINALYAVALRGGTAGTGTSLITLV